MHSDSEIRAWIIGELIPTSEVWVAAIAGVTATAGVTKISSGGASELAGGKLASCHAERALRESRDPDRDLEPALSCAEGTTAAAASAQDDTRAATGDMAAKIIDKIVAMMALSGDMLDQLYVAPTWQRRGVGGAMLSAAMHARPAGLKLWTFQSNAPARRFYEARGFTAIEFTDGQRNEERQPDVLYEWKPGKRE